MSSTVREKREFGISHCVLPYHDRINADPVAEPQCAFYFLDAASSMTCASHVVMVSHPDKVAKVIE
ncbi:hypothetical protein ACC677_36815, partial [Rhizobium ruizarguesonis]